MRIIIEHEEVIEVSLVDDCDLCENITVNAPIRMGAYVVRACDACRKEHQS